MANWRIGRTTRKGDLVLMLDVFVFNKRVDLNHSLRVCGQRQGQCANGLDTSRSLGKRSADWELEGLWEGGTRGCRRCRGRVG